MGGDDSQKLLPWGGSYSSLGRNEPPALPNQHSSSNALKFDGALRTRHILAGTYSQRNRGGEFPGHHRQTGWVSFG